MWKNAPLLFNHRICFYRSDTEGRFQGGGGGRHHYEEMTRASWFGSILVPPPRTPLPHCEARFLPALRLATGLQKPERRLQLKGKDACTLLIGHSIKGHVWGPALRGSCFPSNHTHTALSLDTQGMSRARKQANQSLHLHTLRNTQ